MARLGGGTATKEPKAPKAPRAAKPISTVRTKPSGGTFVGLDIGTHSIKAVELRGFGDKITISALAIGDTPPGLIQGGIVIDAKALGGAIKQLLGKNGIRSGRSVSAATGADAVVVRVIEVPRMTPAELAETMKWEIERHIPFAANDVEMSYQGIVDPKSPDDPNNPNMEVLLAVARRDMVATHLDTLAAAGLKPAAIDVEPLAVGRAVIDLSRNNLTSRNIVVVNMGHSITDVGIFKNGILRFPRTLPIAGETFTRTISDALGLPLDAAEDEKRQNAVVLMELLQSPGASGTGAYGGASAASEPSPFDFDFVDPIIPPVFGAAPVVEDIPSDRLPSVPSDRLPSPSIPSDRLPSAPSMGANVFDIPASPADDPFAMPVETAAVADPNDPFAVPIELPSFNPYGNVIVPGVAASQSEAVSSTVPPVYGATGEPVASSVPAADDPMYRRKREIFDALLPVLGEFTEEIRRSLDYFRSRYPADNIDQIILCGGSARLKNIDQYVQQVLGIPTVVANPFAGLNVVSKQMGPDQLASLAPVFAVAVGLAARDAVLGAGR